MHVSDDLKQRHAAKVDRRERDECWPWIGPANRRRGGYGYLSVPTPRPRKVYAHRVAYAVANRCDIPPPEVVVLHSCDNPPCQNPLHLRAGTAAENRADSVQKGRWRVPTTQVADGYTHWNSKLPNDQRDLIVKRYKAGTKQVALAAEFGISQSTISRIINEVRGA